MIKISIVSFSNPTLLLMPEFYASFQLNSKFYILIDLKFMYYTIKIFLRKIFLIILR